MCGSLSGNERGATDWLGLSAIIACSTAFFFFFKLKMKALCWAKSRWQLPEPPACENKSLWNSVLVVVLTFWLQFRLTCYHLDSNPQKSMAPFVQISFLLFLQYWWYLYWSVFTPPCTSTSVACIISLTRRIRRHFIDKLVRIRRDFFDQLCSLLPNLCAWLSIFTDSAIDWHCPCLVNLNLYTVCSFTCLSSCGPW